MEFINCKNVFLFGSAGTLDKNIQHRDIMVPDRAYRDEGTSYHYAPAADYIKVPNAGKVCAVFDKLGVPYVKGGTWTTDAFFRETRDNFQKRKSEGCISVEMECAAVQAWADFREKSVYIFLRSGDLLDAPEWDRRGFNQEGGANHHINGVELALNLITNITKKEEANQ